MTYRSYLSSIPILLSLAFLSICLYTLILPYIASNPCAFIVVILLYLLSQSYAFYMRAHPLRTIIPIIPNLSFLLILLTLTYIPITSFMPKFLYRLYITIVLSKPIMLSLSFMSYKLILTFMSLQSSILYGTM